MEQFEPVAVEGEPLSHDCCERQGASQHCRIAAEPPCTLRGRMVRSPTRMMCRWSCSTKMPAWLIACGLLAKPPSLSRLVKAALAPRSTRRCRSLTISPRRPAEPEDYAELLEESGVKAQARAPMTPIVKLVFGIDYDKARLTEFAAALSYAQRLGIALGGFQDLIEKQPGGLKALVAAERAARRPETKEDTKGETARARLRAAPAFHSPIYPAKRNSPLC